jgi:hypothetical protein
MLTIRKFTISIALALGLLALTLGDGPADTGQFDPEAVRLAREKLAEKAAARARAATQPSTNPAIDIAKLPTAKATSTPAPKLPTITRLLDDIPIRAWPNPADGWDEFSRPQALKWLEEKAYGLTIMASSSIETVNIIRVAADGDPNSTVGWEVYLEFNVDSSMHFGMKQKIWYAGPPEDLDPALNVAIINNHRMFTQLNSHRYMGVRFVGDERLARVAKHWVPGDKVTFQAGLRDVQLLDTVVETRTPNAGDGGNAVVSRTHESVVISTVSDPSILSAPGIQAAAQK